MTEADDHSSLKRRSSLRSAFTARACACGTCSRRGSALRRTTMRDSSASGCSPRAAGAPRQSGIAKRARLLCETHHQHKNRTGGWKRRGRRTRSTLVRLTRARWCSLTTTHGTGLVAHRRLLSRFLVKLYDGRERGSIGGSSGDVGLVMSSSRVVRRRRDDGRKSCAKSTTSPSGRSLGLLFYSWPKCEH